MTKRIDWTKEMDDIVRTISERPAQDIADELGLSREAVYGRKRQLGLKGRPRGGQNVPPEAYVNFRRWTEEEINVLRELASTTKHRDLAKMLGRSSQAISFKCSELRIAGRPKNADQAKNHANWRGGNSTNYGQHWNTVVKPQVFERDNYMCQEPGCEVFSPSGRLIHPHHIVPRRLTQDDSLSNHVTLCDEHHRTQDAHRWVDVTPDHIDTLPAYQRQILGAA